MKTCAYLGIDLTGVAFGNGLFVASPNGVQLARVAALAQGDDKLQLPLINNLGNEVWKSKEAKQGATEAPTLGDPERRAILVEPQPLLTKVSKMPGLDGQKMSKSYGNTIELRDAPKQVEDKVKRMPTDPARVRRTDPGDPAKCPVWPFHEVYSDDKTRDWATKANNWAGRNFMKYANPEYDKLWDQVLVERDLAKAAEIWMKLNELARYWAARELTRIERDGPRVNFRAPFACPGFTVRVHRRVDAVPLCPGAQAHLHRARGEGGRRLPVDQPPAQSGHRLLGRRRQLRLQLGLLNHFDDAAKNQIELTRELAHVVFLPPLA